MAAVRPEERQEERRLGKARTPEDVKEEVDCQTGDPTSQTDVTPTRKKILSGTNQEMFMSFHKPFSTSLLLAALALAGGGELTAQIVPVAVPRRASDFLASAGQSSIQRGLGNSQNLLQEIGFASDPLSEPINATLKQGNQAIAAARGDTTKPLLERIRGMLRQITTARQTLDSVMIEQAIRYPNSRQQLDSLRQAATRTLSQAEEFTKSTEQRWREDVWLKETSDGFWWQFGSNLLETTLYFENSSDDAIYRLAPNVRLAVGGSNAAVGNAAVTTDLFVIYGPSVRASIGALVVSKEEETADSAGALVVNKEAITRNLLSNLLNGGGNYLVTLTSGLLQYQKPSLNVRCNLNYRLGIQTGGGSASSIQSSTHNLVTEVTGVYSPTADVLVFGGATLNYLIADKASIQKIGIGNSATLPFCNYYLGLKLFQRGEVAFRGFALLDGNAPTVSGSFSIAITP